MPDKPTADSARPQPPTNYRKFRSQTERNLIIGALVIFFLVGGGLIWLLYGSGAVLGGLLCIAGGLALLGGIYLIFKLLEAWSKSDDE